ncbi:MAG: penicillin-binding protein 2 [Alphaproteobacteria bacterium]|nr:penicillin-binding protein 2 [Alphaproteobacteria bacterium]
MKPEQDRGRLFTRRAMILAGGQALMFTGLAARMYYLQVVESSHYRVLAEENRISLRLLPPPRGRILDRRGAPLATNAQNYRVVIVPEEAENIEQMLDRLDRLVQVPEHERRRIMREVRRRRAFVPVTVRENLSWEEVSRIEVNAPDLPGINIDVGETRSYPFDGAAAHVLGYVAAVSERDLTGDPLLELPGFRIGKTGIERQYDLQLRGKAGNAEVEVNALGRVIRELRRQEGQPGQNVHLTIDIGLQEFVAKRVGEERRAAVVVMDAHKGDVLAMVSVPSYDPNAFNEGLSGKEWNRLITNPDTPLTNKVIAGQYAPGSTFKIAVALAALEANIPPSFRTSCYGHVQLGNQKFHCWKKGGHGSVDMLDGIKLSCDVYFYELAKRVGIDRVSAMAKRLGMGQSLDLDIPGERNGLIPTRDWKLAAIGVPWQLGETLVAGIGQGYVLATPLQLAVMTARLVNGGFAVTPRLTLAPPGVDPADEPPHSFPPIGVADASRRLVIQGMVEVVNNPQGGTAFGSRITEKRFAMGGKTGTSQVRRISLAERDRGVRKNEDRPWRERDHALFVGFAPVDAPRYVVSVIVEHGGGGSKAAAPIARDVLLEAQRRDSSSVMPGRIAAAPPVDKGPAR